MEINKYIKEEIFPDGKIEYSGFLITTEKEMFGLRIVRKTYDLHFYDSSLFFEEENDEFPLGEIYKTTLYSDIEEKLRKTLFGKQSSQPTSKINIIKL